MRRHLADIPDLVTEASHYLTPGSAPKDPDARHGTTMHRIPIVAEIADLLDLREKDVDGITLNRAGGDRRLGVLPTLGLWVSLTYTELEDLGHQPRECCPHRSHTLTGEAGWLSEYAEIICELHSDFAHDISLLWTELRKACRIRREYQPRCPHCNNHIQGVYGDTEDQAPAWWRCTACGKTWVHDAEMQRLAMTQPRMTIPQTAKLLGIAVRTLYNWRNLGRFTADSHGKVDLEHVRRAAEKIGRIPA